MRYKFITLDKTKKGKVHIIGYKALIAEILRVPINKIRFNKDTSLENDTGETRKD